VGDFPFDIRTEKDGNVVLSDFERLSVPYKIATDDGSSGFSGFVTECLEEWLNEKAIESDKAIIYGCGPEGMLAGLGKIATKHNIDCQVSMERLMACGIGLCQSCAVKVRSGADVETEYKLCCKDGPVFDSRDVVFC
jgi:dihydroorotate dehydrogenase electron transfer subunit